MSTAIGSYKGWYLWTEEIRKVEEAICRNNNCGYFYTYRLRKRNWNREMTLLFWGVFSVRDICVKLEPSTEAQSSSVDWRVIVSILRISELDKERKGTKASWGHYPGKGCIW